MASFGMAAVWHAGGSMVGNIRRVALVARPACSTEMRA